VENRAQTRPRPDEPAAAHDAQGESAEDRARRLLERVGLGERLHYRPGPLSGGERQRVAVARALINRPALLLADEPTGSLDRASSEDLAQLLVDLNREEGLTLVVVTHSAALAARMKRQLELRDGQLAPLAQSV
jgi:predicted ABC-type transport system involved in lysophospholipase L1 biosynthesis ATPase subunit